MPLTKEQLATLILVPFKWGATRLRSAGWARRRRRRNRGCRWRTWCSPFLSERDDLGQRNQMACRWLTTLTAGPGSRQCSLCRLVRDVGALRQAAAERDVLARRLVERDQKIIWRDSGSRDYGLVQGLQQSKSLLLGTAGDEGNFK